MAIIEKRQGKHGTAWRARVRIKGRSVSATFDSKADAAAWAAQTERAIRAGEALPGEAPPGDRFFRDAADEYERHLGQRKISPSTRRMYAECRMRLEPVFGHMTLRQITRADVMRYRDMRLAKVGPAGVRHDFCYLRGVYKHARLVDGLEIDCPVNDVPAPAPPKNREPILSMRDIDRLLDYCCLSNAPRLYSYVLLMLHTGMRPSEAAALKWEAVRPADRLIILTTTKSGRSRSVPLTDAALALFRRLEPFRRGDYVFFDATESEADGKTVLIQPTLRQVPSYHFRGAFKRAAKAAGLPGLSQYDLRHIAASWLIMGGVDIRTVADILGHGSITMTMRYTHLLDRHKIAAIKALNGLG